jgi:hypothetical protein
MARIVSCGGKTALVFRKTARSTPRASGSRRRKGANQGGTFEARPCRSEPVAKRAKRDRSGVPESEVGCHAWAGGPPNTPRKSKRVKRVGSPKKGRGRGGVHGKAPGPPADRGGCIVTSQAEISRRSGNAMMRRLVGPLRK